MKIDITPQELADLVLDRGAERDAALLQAINEQATLKAAVDRAAEQERAIHRDYATTQHRFSQLQELIVKATGCDPINTRAALIDMIERSKSTPATDQQIGAAVKSQMATGLLDKVVAELRRVDIPGELVPRIRALVDLYENNKARRKR